jgi:hypothetical protein
MSEKILSEDFGKALYNHIAGLPTDTRQQIRKRVERRTARTAADKRGKAAFLFMLDEIEKSLDK